MAQNAMLAEEVTWTDPTCPVARTLDLMGDRWSLLIVRDAMDGARAFTDFQQRTGIAHNILTDRLRRLVERGILDRQTGRHRAGGSNTHSPPPGATCSPSYWPCASGANATLSLPTRPTPSLSMSSVSRFRGSSRSAQTATSPTSSQFVIKDR